MKKWEELMEYLQKKDFRYVKELKDFVGKELGLVKVEEKKKTNVWAIVLAVVGAVAAMVAVAYADT